MSTPIVAEFTDRFGETRQIHRNKNGLAVKRGSKTVALRLNSVIAGLIGARICAERTRKGYTLEQLCLRAGLVSTTPKSRMWEIENNVRKEGLRFGTLVAVAVALDVEVSSLLPTNAEVLELAPVEIVTEPTLAVAV